MEIRYLNTDLEIESENDISRIVEEFGDDVMLLHHGEIRGYMHASFETAGFRIGADEAIETFCSLVENFPEEVREIWDNCCTRIFDIGYESGLSSTSFRSEIRESTVQRMGKIKASIRITIYPGSKEGGAGD